ncbi:hypothetical protein OROGR_000561 [Orobanche gracilis]
MVKHKEVGVSGSSKKKTGVSNQRSEVVKLKKRCRKIKKVVVNKGKRPIMRFDNVRVVRKKRKKTSKDADYTEGESETENHTKSGNKSEYSVRNAIINDVLEAPTSDYNSESGDDRKTKRLLPTNCFAHLKDTDEFILGGKEVQLSGRDVALIFGIYCLCEHTCLVKPSRKVLFPRFMKWDLQKLIKRNFRVHLSYVDSSYKKIRELIEGCGIGSNDHHIRKEDFDCETDCGKVDTSAAMCSTDQDMCDEAEDIHPTAELGGDSPETHRRRDAAHVDIASSSKTPLKAFGGNVVKGDIFQPRSFKNGSTVIRETAIRETAFQESAFGETVIRETAKPETAKGENAIKDTEPIISSCPSFSLDITQLRTPTQKSVHNDIEEMNSNTNLGKVDPAIDEVDVIIDEWQPQNLDLPEDGDLNINTGGLKLCIRGTDLESTIEKLKLEKELEKAAFKDRLKAFEEQSKQMCELNEARFRAMEEQNRRLLNDNEILRANMVDTSIPTHTQIYSDPKNLEKIDAWTSMHLAKLKNEGKKSKVKSPNSMTKRIKDIAVIGDRKAKDITSSLEKKELKRRTEIQYVEVEEYDKELNVEKVNEKTFKGLDARYHAVSKASGHLRSLVSSHCNYGPASVVWRGLAPLAEVTEDDIVNLLHHKPLKGKIYSD